MTEVSKTTLKDKYPRQLTIYDAGDTRTAFVSFWKATAIFQFGFAVVWIAPMLYKNENQPDEHVRFLQTVGVTVLAAVPMFAMSYLTAPFVKRVMLEIPDRARVSRDALIAFSRKVPENTRLEFTTLRTFPFRRTTGATLGDLRALPPQRGRFANIELLKTKQWRQTQKQLSIFVKFFNILSEPRWKFYVKEGRTYTILTKVPGVWENVALAIQQKTLKEAAEEANAAARAKTKTAQKVAPRYVARPVKPVTPVLKTQPVAPKLRRQTSRLR